MKKDPNLPWFHPSKYEAEIMGWRDETIIGKHVPVGAAVSKICGRLDIFRDARDYFVAAGFDDFDEVLAPGPSRLRAIRLNITILEDALAELDNNFAADPLRAEAASGIADIEAFLGNQTN